MYRYADTYISSTHIYIKHACGIYIYYIYMLSIKDCPYIHIWTYIYISKSICIKNSQRDTYMFYRYVYVYIIYTYI